MAYLSISELSSYLDPRAFSVSRTTARGAIDITETASAIKAGDTNVTMSLLLGAEQRLADLRSNLQSMLDLSIAGAQSNGNEREYDEAYGKLRSLTAGFDQVISASTFSGQELFDGRKWDLEANGQPVNIDTLDLRAAGENLGLVQRSDGATVTVGYDIGTIIRNANSGLKGLDISDAVGVPRTDGMPELENGKYRLEIEYDGPNSSLFLSDEFGAKIETLTDIDLTGSGIDIIKFKAGIQISLEKLQTSIYYDKWDYETDGPISLYADLQYERVSWHTLTGDTKSPDSTSEADWSYKPKKDYNEPALNFDSISTNGVTDGNLEFAEGSYSLKVKYRGDASIVEVRDLNGNMMLRLDDVELGPDSGTYTVDTGRGVKFSIENNGWGDTQREIRANFTYKPAGNSNRDFDFIEYGQKIVDAISVLDEQLSTVTSSITSIRENYLMTQGQSSQSSGANVTSILGVGGTVYSLLSGSNVSARLSVSGMQLFSSINSSVDTQGSSTTNVLSYLA